MRSETGKKFAFQFEGNVYIFSFPYIIQTHGVIEVGLVESTGSGALLFIVLVFAIGLPILFFLLDNWLLFVILSVIILFFGMLAFAFLKKGGKLATGSTYSDIP